MASGGVVAHGTLALKIDVDTYHGMKNGVPVLLDTLRAFGLKGSFFLSIGPDYSGRAVWQLIKNPRFLKKMLKTRAPALYGWKTSLYGTLLPAPMIALSFPDLVCRIRDEGHEIQFHAWDHRRWQDDLPSQSESWIREWFQKGVIGFERLTGMRPTAFGAPSWTIDERVLKLTKALNLSYLSCTRAREPFIHDLCDLIEIPSDLPCFEELQGTNPVNQILKALLPGQTHVLPVHAEVEGGIYQTLFKDLLDRVIGAGYQIQTLQEVFEHTKTQPLKIRRHQMALLEGRHSPCAV